MPPTSERLTLSKGRVDGIDEATPIGDFFDSAFDCFFTCILPLGRPIFDPAIFAAVIKFGCICIVFGSEPGEALAGGVGVGVDRPYRSGRISGLRCVGVDGEGIEGECREPGRDWDWG